MFKSLKDKLTSWFKKPEEEKTSKTKSAKEKKEIKPKKNKEKPVKPSKIKKETKKKKIEEIKEEVIQETPQKIEEKPVIKPQETVHDEKLQKGLEELEKEIIDEQKPADEKQGFFSKIFSRKKSGENLTQEKSEESAIIEQKVPEQSIPEAIKEEPKKIQEPEKQEGFFSKLASKLSTSTLAQEQFDELFQELEITLLENNVALDVVEKIHKELSKDLVGIEVKKAKVNETIINSLKNSILEILTEPPNLIEAINKKHTGPYVIIFVGINGSGKTTSIAKVAHYLKENNISCVLGAADTFRAASIEQLQQHADKLHIPIVKHTYGSDPAAVAFDTKKYAEIHKIKAVLIDTAGRMYTKTNLIKEMEKIVRVSQPDLKIFLAESITGNDALEQAKTFNESINIDGIILSKADVDEKAGTILSVSYVTKKPIYFLGTGQNYKDLTPFTKSTVLKNLGLE
ncbi:MAG: signal recognition particle-docking protein FtsY [Nanoarchaeota archaeon]|nr:signal recognition particle-docking protein FtsY [Nanoarchaeota archaeon]